MSRGSERAAVVGVKAWRRGGASGRADGGCPDHPRGWLVGQRGDAARAGDGRVGRRTVTCASPVAVTVADARRARRRSSGVTTAAATLPSSCPRTPLRRWEPSTIRLALRSSAVSTIPFQVGAASTAMLCDRNPAFSASEAPWLAVCSRGLLAPRSRSGRRSAGRRRARIRRLPVARRRGRARRGRVRAAGRPARSRAGRARSRRRRRGRVRRPRRRGVWPPSQSALSVATCVVAMRPRSFASSGGEYQAGRSPARKRSRSGVCGRAPPSA